MAFEEVTANYVGAFDGSLHFGSSPALVIVDVVMAYLDPDSPLYAACEDALESNMRLLAAARASGIPVIFSNVVFQAGGLDGGLFFCKVPALKVFTPGSPMGSFHPQLAPKDGEIVITKQYASAFFGTSLASTLTALRVDTVLVTGFSTSGCVRATALDALCEGFAPFVIRDAAADRDSAVHEGNLFDLQAKYAEVVETAAMLDYLNSLGR